MGYQFQPIALMGEQFNPMDSLAQTAQLQAAYQQNQMRAMQIAEMQRQQQEANAVRTAGRNAATYAPQATVNSPAMTLGGMSLPNITPPSQVQGPAGADFRNQYVAQLAQQGQGQMIPGAQQEFAQQDMAKAKLLQEQQKMVDEHSASQALASKNNSEAGKFDADAQMKHIDMIGAASNALLQLPPEQAQAAYPVTVAMLQSQGVDVSKFPPQFDPNIVGQAAQMAVSAKEQLTLQESKRHNQAMESKTGVDEQAAADWMSKNPGKGMSDYILWKAKNSPTAMMGGGINLTPEATAMAANLYSQTGQLPAGFSRAPQVTSQVINQAAKNSPDIAANKLDFGAKKSTKTYFTSGAGGKQLTAFNTAIVHLDTLDRLAGDLNNGNIQIFNKAAQAWAQQTGGAAPANFEAAKNAMSGEVAAALKASGATDQEISHVSSTFDRAQSPAQLKGAINTYRELLKGKAVQLKKQYDAGMKGGAAFDNGTSGVSVTDPRGVVHQFPNQQAAEQFKAAAGIK